MAAARFVRVSVKPSAAISFLHQLQRHRTQIHHRCRCFLLHRDRERVVPRFVECQGAEFARLENAIRMDACSWDVVEVTDAQFVRGARLGLYSALTADLDAADFRTGDFGQYGVANVYWATQRMTQLIPNQVNRCNPCRQARMISNMTSA